MNWDQYFLNIAEQVKEKSKDQRTQDWGCDSGAG